MALATVNGLDVLEATIRLPRRGRWTARLAVAAESADGLEGAVSIALGDALTLQGTTKRAGAFAGSVTLRAVGGAGGLWKEVKPKAYQGVPVRLPLTETLAEVGEQLAASSDAAVLGVPLPKWTRFGGTAFEEVEHLIRAAGGASFRFLPDGTLWVGEESWPDSGLQQDRDFSLLDDMRWCGQVELGVETPTLLPGTTLLGRHVDLVEHRIAADRVRTMVTFADDEDPSREPDPATEGQVLLSVIDRRLRPTRYHALQPAQVVKQNPDGTLELKLDDSEAPGLSNVPMRTATPSMTVKVASGSRCAVAFEGGDPQRPVATLFELGSLLELAITAGTQVTLKAPSVRLGSDVDAELQPAALGAKLDAFLATLATWLNAHTHVTTCAVGPGTAAPSLPSLVPADSVSSSAVKVKV